MRSKRGEMGAGKLERGVGIAFTLPASAMHVLTRACMSCACVRMQATMTNVGEVVVCTTQSVGLLVPGSGAKGVQASVSRQEALYLTP